MEWPEEPSLSDDNLEIAGPEEDIDALYDRSLSALQEGRWREAVDSLEEVLRQRPDHSDAAALLEEARLKASLERGKPSPKLRLPRLPVRPLLLVLGPITAVVLTTIGIREAYSRWVLPPRVIQEEQQRRIELLEGAFSLLANQDYVSAEAAFSKVLTVYPDSEEAQQGLETLQERMSLDAQYAAARQAIDSGYWKEARGALDDLLAADSGYRDAEELLVMVQRQQELESEFSAAEAAYDAGQWLEAVAAYQALVALDEEHEKDAVTPHLFESYLHHGRDLIHSTQGEGEAVREALDWFQRALIMLPQHQRALYEIALAERYLQGRRLLAQPRSSGEESSEDDSLPLAIAELQWVYQQEPDYADGVVADILKAATERAHEPEPAVGGDFPVPPIPIGSFEQRYSGHMQQGDAAMDAADPAGAEEYYREGATVAVHGGVDAAKWLFAAYVKLGTAQTAQDKTAEAVESFQTAIAVMGASAEGIPEEVYADFVAEGDQLAAESDYAGAIEQYARALQTMGVKCDCGLEDWRFSPWQ